MCRSIVDIQFATAEIRRGIRKRRKKKPQDKNIMSASATQGGHNKNMLARVKSCNVMQVKTNYMNLYSPIKINSNTPAKHQHRNVHKKKTTQEAQLQTT